MSDPSSRPDTSDRPIQVTVAGWVIALGSVLVILSIFDAIGNLRSIAMRDEIIKALGTGSAKDLGLSIDQVTTILRVSLVVTGAAAAAAAVLGVFVLQRHRAARIGVSVAAVPILLTGPFAGGVLAMVVAASAAMLWTRPARDWYAGRPPSRPDPRPDPADQVVPPPAPVQQALSTQQPSTEHTSAEPPPTSGFGDGPTTGTTTGPTTPASPMTNPPPFPPSPPFPIGPPVPYPAGPAGVPMSPPPGSPSEVPSPVKTACILTWVFAGLTAVATVLVGIGLVAARADIVREIQKSAEWKNFKSQSGMENITIDTIIAVLWVAVVLMLVWSVLSMLAAAFTWRRQNWARILLIISASVAGLFSLFAIPGSLLHLAACIAVVVLLLTPAARGWFQNLPPGPPPGQPGPPRDGPETPEDQRPKVW